jgi:hypothetical protein
MRIFIEGVKYSRDQLMSAFDDSKFFYLEGKSGIINSVGYYHSFINNELVYLLPKVFLTDGLVFGLYSPSELLQIEKIESLKHSPNTLWIRQLIIYFYKSLAEFRKRNKASELIETNEILELNSNIGDNEYSFLDLILSFVNFHKKNKTQILYRHIEHTTSQVKKPKWERTIRKSLPVIINDVPIYTTIVNKDKTRNPEEELITYFYSILTYLNNEYALGLKIDSSIKIIKGEKFNSLSKTGISKLRKIKYRYFSDTLIKMYRLVYLYFHQTDLTNSTKKREDFIAVKNYNIVFEDMVDKLFSDSLNGNAASEKYGLNELKNNKDGKIIDHIYEDKSLIDTSNIFYIGDSKYYKPGSAAGNVSIFKQFTYSKNIIQFNIDLLNRTSKYYNENIRYRDELTEGYNITPNFFIFGFIPDYKDFNNSHIEKYQETKQSYHFADRLFDRDSLFIQQYKINFLYVVKSYSSSNHREIELFREKVKSVFRKRFIDYFNSPDECNFKFYSKEIEKEKAIELMDSDFRRLNGKCFYKSDNKMIIAIKEGDLSLGDLLTDFEKYSLS